MLLNTTSGRLFLACIVLASCAGPEAGPTAEGHTTSTPDTAVVQVTYPYPMAYSANFVLTDPELGRKVLELWKRYDANTLAATDDLLADTVALELPGLSMRAGRDSVVFVLRARRSDRPDLRTEMDVVMSVREPDKAHDWVLTWAIERYTDKAGVEHAMKYQQVWGFNKKGKVTLIEQFDRVLK